MAAMSTSRAGENFWSLLRLRFISHAAAKREE